MGRAWIKDPEDDTIEFEFDGNSLTGRSRQIPPWAHTNTSKSTGKRSVPADPETRAPKLARVEENPQEAPQTEAPPSKMDVDQNGQESAKVQSSGNQLAAKETPVIWHQPTIGFRETHTTIIPVDFYGSMNHLALDDGLDGEVSKNQLRLRMNSPYEPILTPLVNQVAGAGSRLRGFSRDKSTVDTVANPSPLFSFPSTLTLDLSITPAWLAYWEKIYQSYTVLETRWEIYLVLASGKSDVKANVMWDYNTYGTSSTGNVMPAAPYYIMDTWGLNRVKLSYIDNDNVRESPNRRIIKGTWKPGMIQRNVKNDGDNKTWITVGAPPDDPAYVEELDLRFFDDPFNFSTTARHINFQVKLFYTVQFKDLQENFRYPNNQDDITLDVPSDILTKF